MNLLQRKRLNTNRCRSNYFRNISNRVDNKSNTLSSNFYFSSFMWHSYLLRIVTYYLSSRVWVSLLIIQSFLNFGGAQFIFLWNQGFRVAPFFMSTFKRMGLMPDVRKIYSETLEYKNVFCLLKKIYIQIIFLYYNNIFVGCVTINRKKQYVLNNRFIDS